jgi:hypothetical protein
MTSARVATTIAAGRDPIDTIDHNAHRGGLDMRLWLEGVTER